MREGFTYIMSNFKRNVLYVGVTSNIEWRVLAHKTGQGSTFTSRYKTTFLVYYERFPTIIQAIYREKQLKSWRKEWKFDLIRTLNPDMDDLAADWYTTEDLSSQNQSCHLNKSCVKTPPERP